MHVETLRNSLFESQRAVDTSVFRAGDELHSSLFYVLLCYQRWERFNQPLSQMSVIRTSFVHQPSIHVLFIPHLPALELLDAAQISLGLHQLGELDHFLDVPRGGVAGSVSEDGVQVDGSAFWRWRLHPGLIDGQYIRDEIRVHLFIATFGVEIQ